VSKFPKSQREEAAESWQATKTSFWFSVAGTVIVALYFTLGFFFDVQSATINLTSLALAIVLVFAWTFTAICGFWAGYYTLRSRQ